MGLLVQKTGHSCPHFLPPRGCSPKGSRYLPPLRTPPHNTHAHLVVASETVVGLKARAELVVRRQLDVQLALRLAGLPKNRNGGEWIGVWRAH